MASFVAPEELHPSMHGSCTTFCFTRFQAHTVSSAFGLDWNLTELLLPANFSLLKAVSFLQPLSRDKLVQLLVRLGWKKEQLGKGEGNVFSPKAPARKPAATDTKAN